MDAIPFRAAEDAGSRLRGGCGAPRHPPKIARAAMRTDARNDGSRPIRTFLCVIWRVRSVSATLADPMLRPGVPIGKRFHGSASGYSCPRVTASPFEPEQITSCTPARVRIASSSTMRTLGQRLDPCCDPCSASPCPMLRRRVFLCVGNTPDRRPIARSSRLPRR